jgi:hypothetical protein
MLKEALEEQGSKVFETDKGFVAYKDAKDTQGVPFIGIISLFLKKEERNQTSFQSLVEGFESMCREQEQKNLVWPVMLEDPGKEGLAMAQLSMGFKIHSADPKRVVMSKQLN